MIMACFCCSEVKKRRKKNREDLKPRYEKLRLIVSLGNRSLSK